MSSSLTHHVISADVVAPSPYRAFAVRSDEPQHAWSARAPYAKVHLVRGGVLDARSLAPLAAQGYAQVCIKHFSDIDYATTSLAELASTSPHETDLPGSIAASLQRTGVLGDELADYRRSVEARIDYLASRGAGFHNDVARHWSRCLFWLLALDLADVEFVMPHAGLRLALMPGDLLVFDQTLAHGLCRPTDQGLALASSFEAGEHDRQIFLTGELVLGDDQWAALGSPWLPVEEHERRGALDLMVAEFDDRSGAVKRLHALRDSMKRSTCHVEVASD
jgi:hypothetical protein